MKKCSLSIREYLIISKFRDSYSKEKYSEELFEKATELLDIEMKPEKEFFDKDYKRIVNSKIKEFEGYSILDLMTSFKERNPNVNISLGCIDGTNWLYIGQPDDFLNKFDSISEKYIDKINHFIECNHKSIINEVKLYSKNKTLGQSDEAYINKLNKINDACNKYHNKIKSFVPFKERKVKKISPKIDDTEISILIEGNENGNFWNLEEVKYSLGEN